MKKLLGILVLGLVLFSSGSHSKESIFKGKIYEDEFKLNRNLIFKLPQGEWRVVEKYADSFRGLTLGSIDLVLLDENQIKGAFAVTEINTGGWRMGLINQLVYSFVFQNRYDGCYERSEYYIVKVNRQGTAINCLVIRHNDWQRELYQPDDPEEKTSMAIWKSFIKSNNIKIPSITLSSEHLFFAPAISNKYLSIMYITNPELYGDSKSKFTTEETSEYHRANIDQYPDKKKFMEDWVKISAKRHKIFEKIVKAKPRYKLDLSDYFEGEIIEETKTFKSDKSSKNDDIVKQLEDLKKLYDSGALTEEEYKKAKKKTLD
jgi:hypothetical protein